MSTGLKEKTIKGFFWSGIGDVANKGVGFLFGIVLARLLDPADYGLTAMIGVFMSIASTFVDSGFKSALIRKEEISEADYSTAFFFNVLVSLVCYLLLFMVSPSIATFYNRPILSPILRLQALSVIINAFTLVPFTRFTRKIDFKTQSKILVTSNVLSCVIGILFAFWGYGVWALVAMNLSYSLSSAILLWISSPWKPIRCFSKSSFDYLFGYGSKLLATGLLNTIFNNINPIVIGRLFSASSLGYYTKALGVADIPSTNVTVMIQRVTFPVMSQMQNDIEKLRHNYRKLIKMSAYIIFPLSIGLAAVSYPLVSFLYGEKWTPCVPYLQVICFSVMWYPIHSLNLNLLQVKGRSDLFLKLEIIKKILFVFVIVFAIPFGVMGICVGGVVSSLLSLVINTYYTGKLIDVGYFVQMRDVAKSLINSLIMGLIAFLISRLTSIDIVNVVLGIVIGATYYMASSYILKFQEFKETMNLFKNRM